MSNRGRQTQRLAPVVGFHLLGRIDFDECLSLQLHLVEQAALRDDCQIKVLVCEHPELITIGRGGSRAHIHLDNDELRRRQLSLRWVTRGGGCILHAPGQLAIYPIVPLHRFGWTVGAYLRRLQGGIVAALQVMHIPAETPRRGFGVGGRTGRLVAFGVAVRHWVTWHGAFINVNPEPIHFGYLDVIAPEGVKDGDRTTMSCLVAERRRPVRMSEVRATVIPHLAAAFGCERYHLHTGHRLLLEEPTLA